MSPGVPQPYCRILHSPVQYLGHNFGHKFLVCSRTRKTRNPVFSGLIRVSPEGKKTAAYQQNRNLLLSPKARADSIPNLEIGANDIIGCTHGATVGKVDEEQLFYLMCRGLSRIEATHLIVEGFVDPLIEQVPIPGLREALRYEIQRRVSALQAL